MGMKDQPNQRQNQSSSGANIPRIVLLVFVVTVAVFAFGSKSFGPDIEGLHEDLKAQLAKKEADHAVEVARLKDALANQAGDKKSPDGGKKPKKDKSGAKATPAPPPPTTEAAAELEPVAEAKGAENSPESNNMPEDIHHPEEKTFKHYIGELPELPEDASAEMKQMHKAFTMYNADRSAVTNVPVYGTACIGEVDCPYVKNQMQSLDTGVGHVVVVLNRDHQESLALFRSWEKAFPGRFTLQYRPDGGGCAESWNIMLRLGFSITPEPTFVMATNGDLWALPGYLAKFAKFMHEKLESEVGARFVHFSSFGLNRRGWAQLGPFDESIFPAYAEDVEYHIRAVSKGVHFGSFPGMSPDRSHKHAGSRSFADKKFNEMYQRWDKNDYMFRKWGVDMRMYSDYQHCHPFSHPWNQPTMTHRKSWVVDFANHRKCIRTGQGIVHNAHHGGCMLSSCRSCWYNASVLLPLLPPGTVLPDNIMSQNRVKY